MDEKIIIDFTQKKTEAEVIKDLDNFAVKAAPLWFGWISWTLEIGVLEFFFKKSSSLYQKIGLVTVIAISLLFLWTHFIAVFYKIEFQGIPFLKSPRKAQIASLIVSGVLAFIAWKLATELALIAATMGR